MKGMTLGRFKEVTPTFSREAILHILKENIRYEEYKEFFPFGINIEYICDEIMKLKQKQEGDI